MTERREIFVVGFPRSGNSWLSRLLGDFLNCPVASGQEIPSNADEGHDRPGPYVVRLNHPSQLYDSPTRESVIEEFGGKVAVEIVRDPRDVLLSIREYYESNWEDALIRMRAWPATIRACESIPVRTHYEDLYANTASELLRILVMLDLPYHWDGLHEAVQRQSWDVRVANLSDDMPYSAAHQRRAFGHGEVGRWRTEVPNDILMRGMEIFGAMLSEIGYGL